MSSFNYIQIHTQLEKVPLQSALIHQLCFPGLWLRREFTIKRFTIHCEVTCYPLSVDEESEALREAIGPGLMVKLGFKANYV